MITMGIETSCDETAVSVVCDGKVLSNEVSSSVELHAQYGGVVPEIASRYHTEYMYSVFEKSMEDAAIKVEDIDLVAMTDEPGLPGSLLVGSAFAKALSYAAGKPVVGVNHLYGHILSCFISGGEFTLTPDMFPFLGMVISGGHTSIYLCRALDDFEVIGRTRDDAIGEAFDKVAKVLGLGYPGGPVVERLASEYDGSDPIPFPRALLKGDDSLDFSLSGIKTAVMYHWKAAEKTEEEKKRVCFSFQEAVSDIVDEKIKRALRQTGIERLAVGGGVVNNTLLRDRITKRAEKEKIELFIPEREYCSDNAAMVAVLGEEMYKNILKEGA